MIPWSLYRSVLLRRRWEGPDVRMLTSGWSDGGGLSEKSMPDVCFAVAMFDMTVFQIMDLKKNE